ncbi:MAG: ATP-binding protein [Terriglobales bacterium]|jgi:DNA replication protein DnaC
MSRRSGACRSETNFDQESATYRHRLLSKSLILRREILSPTGSQAVPTLQLFQLFTLAGGILDRLVHNAHCIEMRGKSMRKKRNPPQDEKKE